MSDLPVREPSYRPRRVWFWLPAIVLGCLGACLLESMFFITFSTIMRGNRYIQLIHSGGVIEMTVSHETHMPSGRALTYGTERGSRREFGRQFGMTRQFFPRFDWPGPSHPTPTRSWGVRMPHLFLIAAYLIVWWAIHARWQRRKARLLKLHAASFRDHEPGSINAPDQG
jgi:hypothetical protein